MESGKKSKPVLVRLEPAVYDQLREKAGPTVPGRGGGVAHYLRILAYRDLGLEPPEMYGENVSSRIKGGSMPVIVRNHAGKDLTVSIGGQIDIEGGNRDFCGTVLGVENTPQGVYVIIHRKDGWGNHGPGIARVNSRVLKRCQHLPVRQFEVIEDYWRSIRLAFQKVGELPPSPDFDNLEALVPSGERAGWQHKMPARQLFSIVAQHAALLLGATPARSIKAGVQLVDLVDSANGATSDPAYVELVQSTIARMMGKR